MILNSVFTKKTYGRIKLYKSTKFDLDEGMFVLGIESSCDETSVALVYHPQDFDPNNSDFSYFQWLNKTEVIASQISSQVAVHAPYGGVIPEIGAREHAKAFHPMLQSLLAEAAAHPYLSQFSSQRPHQILRGVDAIAVTTAPGLVSALRVGVEAARSIQFFTQLEYNHSIKIIEVNHLQGHVASSFFQRLNSSAPSKSGQVQSEIQVFPHVHLLVSGGNSQIILMQSAENWRVMGRTLDDAAGECFDKCGRMVGLPYPAGVLVSKIAGSVSCNPCNFPIGMKKSSSLDMSFSGLKTAVRYFIYKQNIPDFTFEKPLSQSEIDQLLSGTFSKTNSKLQFIFEVCVSLQHVIVTQLLQQLSRAIKKFHPTSIGLSGGVSANPLLRLHCVAMAKTHGISVQNVLLPHRSLTGDNAVMIALAGLSNHTCKTPALSSKI